MTSILLKARAKINLTLDVTGKREDGYHFVKMIMQTISLCDTVLIKKVHKPGIWLKCDVKWLPCDERNIAYKAAALMIETFGIKQGVSISIRKRIPVAAGLAGGSADCAAVIKGMNDIFELGLDEQSLMEIGSKLGSDVPFCIMEGTALAEGTGNILTRLEPCPELNMVLVKLPVSVSTATVYKNLNCYELPFHPDTEKMLCSIKNKDVGDIASGLSNVLETVTIKMHPRIDNIKNKLIENGALGSVMSGSGPTVFGIFADRQTACDAADKIRAELKLKSVYVVKTEDK
ncbi:MAG: 4-(cytidine 5'-diphospho)-2-C-methyl-D-erythritol kinase [Lachnospiraceae bacterium]|nr:4-(cytidine 5'-diphospho)-2-C-methyl-D-erythritol kinase [Lachnospiraceae bacterium]